MLLLAAALTIPLGLDLYLPVPEDNPLTTGKIEQGRRLFFDRRLSRDGSISCSSCHDPDRAFSDDRPVAVGIAGRTGRRNSPALINRGYGGGSTLEEAPAALSHVFDSVWVGRNWVCFAFSEA